MELLAQYLSPHVLSPEAVSAAADYSVVGATVGVFAAMYAVPAEPGEPAGYGEWAAVGAAAAAAFVLTVKALGA